MYSDMGLQLVGTMIGFGNIARAHLAAYEQISGIRIAAIVDPSPRRRQEAAQLAGVAVYESMDELDGSRFDFVDICTPPFFHLQNIRAALAMGCHVFCEKPLLSSIADYGEVLELSRRAGKAVVPSHNYKFAPTFTWAKRLIRSVSFGSVVSGHFRTLRPGHAIGTDGWQPNWRRDEAVACGGILTDHGIHSAYLASFLTDLEPRAVSCSTGQLATPCDYRTEDTAFLTIWFSETLSFKVDLSWAGNLRQTSYLVVGEREGIYIDQERIRHLGGNGAGPERPGDPGFDDPLHRAWFRDALVDFTEIIGQPDRWDRSLAEAYMATAVICTAYESAARRGATLEVPRFQAPSSCNAKRPRPVRL
jgi:predicted dehydrogenase